MTITFKRGVHRIYFVLCLLWAAYALFYPYKYRADQYGSDIRTCYDLHFDDQYYASDGNRILYLEFQDLTYLYDKDGVLVNKVKGKVPVARIERGSELTKRCFADAQKTYDKGAYHVLLTDDPLYEGDKRGTYWWRWLLIPMALVMPPAAIYAFLFGTSKFIRWLYRGFVPAKNGTAKGKGGYDIS